MKRFLKPARAGLIVRDERTLTPLAADGEWKELSIYWRRRVRFGDAVFADPPKAKAADEVATKAKPKTTKAEPQND